MLKQAKEKRKPGSVMLEERRSEGVYRYNNMEEVKERRGRGGIGFPPSRGCRRTKRG